MQETVVLEAQSRKEEGKSQAKALRRDGFIPAVVYGEGKQTHSITLSHHDFVRLVHQHHHLESILVTLKIKGHGSRKVLVKEIQYHPVHGDVVHIDFQEISLTEKIKVNVGIVAKGEPVGVKQEEGVLNHLLWELEVECLPTQIPEEIHVDVSQLKIGDTIHVRDISLPDGVKSMVDADSIVFSVEPPIKEEEITPPPVEGEEITEPEVIKEKKEVPEGEEAEAKQEKEPAPRKEKKEKEKEKEKE